MGTPKETWKYFEFERQLWQDFLRAIKDDHGSLNQNDYNRLLYAFNIAKTAHRGKMRATGEPYIEHPVRVALILSSECGITNSRVLAAALDHDVVEDAFLNGDEDYDSSCDRAFEILSSQIGEEAAGWVIVLTKPRIDGVEIMDEEARLAAYMEGLVSDSEEVLLIKMADRLHNDRTLYGRAFDKQQEQLAESGMYLNFFRENQYRAQLYPVAYGLLVDLLIDQYQANQEEFKTSA